MQAILQRRWTECVICIAHGAPLAATVMIGGLLEGLLLARINRENNKAPIFTAAAAPKDKQNKTLPLKVMDTSRLYRRRARTEVDYGCRQGCWRGAS